MGGCRRRGIGCWTAAIRGLSFCASCMISRVGALATGGLCATADVVAIVLAPLTRRTAFADLSPPARGEVYDRASVLVVGLLLVEDPFQGVEVPLARRAAAVFVASA